MMSPRWIVLSTALATATATFTAASTARAVACSTDEQCGATPQTPACNTTKGVCEECTQANDTRCKRAGSRTPVCLPQYGLCGCTSDQQCGAETSGIICSRPGTATDSPPYCKAGCVEDGPGGRNGCAAGQTCTAGQCEQSCIITAPICPSAPLNTCALVSSSGLVQCVECQTDTQCASKPGAQVCDTDVNRCVQCTNNADCSSAPNGSICRPGTSPLRSCGCNSTNDCGPGRTCDPTIKACVLTAAGDAGTDAGDAGGDGSVGDGSVGEDGSVGDGSVGEDGSAGDGSVEEDAGNGDGSTADGSTGDGGTGDGSTADGGGIGDAGNADTGAGGDSGGGRNDAGNGDENDGNYMTSLEGGGCSCSVVPSEDSLPIGGLLAVGGFFAFFTRRRARNAKKDDKAKQP